MAERRYSGPPLDLREQYITERPELDDRDDDDEENQDDDVDVETVYVTDPEPPGEERTENVPVPEYGREESPWIEPADTEQSTFDDWEAP